MLRRILIFLLVAALAVPAAAQNQFDFKSLKKQTVKTARSVDSFLAKRQKKQNTDTSYIFKPQEKWLFRTRSDVTQTFLQSKRIDADTGIDLGFHLKSNPKYRQNFGVGYRGVVLGFGIGIPFKHSDKELALTVYTNPAGGEISYGKILSLKGTESINDESHEMKEGELICRNIKIGGYYAFNWKKFSLPAAMNQSLIQRKSAGSPFATMDFRWVKTEPSEDWRRSFFPFETQSFFFGVGGGYGYNWVPSPHWLLHASVMETIGFVGTTKLTYDLLLTTKEYRYRTRFVPLVSKGNLAVIYYYKKFYVGAYGTVDNLFLPTREKESGTRINIALTRASGHLTIGFRI